MREGIVSAFQQLLSEESGWRTDIEGMHLQSLNLNEAEVLELPFTEEEIHFALMEIRLHARMGSQWPFGNFARTL